MKLSEKAIARQITDLLELDSWRILYCEPVSRREWGKGFGERGMPDVLAIRYGRGALGVPTDGSNDFLLWIEMKRPGGKAAAHQLAWHAAERARGALTLIAGVDFAPSLEGFAQWYAASGLLRRKGLCDGIAKEAMA